MIYSVSTAGGLATAAKYASGGDTIVLQAGTYSDVTLKSLNFASAVTITSADPNNPAVLADLTLTSVNNLTIQDVKIQVGDSTALAISKSKNIVVQDVEIAGTAVEKPGGSGVKIDESDYITIKDSQVHNLGYGITHLNTDHLTISGNTVENIRVDGIRGGGSSWVEISDNVLRNFYRDPGEHGDAIQFWTNGIKVSAHDIVVKDNLIERGEGNRMQGIFFGDEARGKIPYLNVEITGNTVLGTMYHGISLYSAKGAVVSGNTVVGYDDMKSWIRLDGTTDVALTNNVSTQFTVTADSVGTTRTDNQTVSQVSIDGSRTYVDAYQKSLGATLVSKTQLVQADAGVAPEAVTTVIIGNTSGNDIKGTAGADLIDGGKGNDTMAGGTGDDTYMVDSSKDVVVELPGGGIDTVLSTSTSFKLGANVENLTLRASTAQSGVGNELDNVLVANKFESKLSGAAGNDTLVSQGGADTLTGGAGADTFRFDAMPSKVASITDFTSGEDHIDLRALLGSGVSNPLGSGWVKTEVSDTGLTILVDADGPSGSAGFTAVANLTGVKALSASDWIF